MVDRLPSDILRFIGLKLDSAADRIRFRAVSKSWRSALPFRHPPLLMVVSELDKAIELINAGEQTVSEMDFRKMKKLIHQTRMVGSTGNWVITETVPHRKRKEMVHLLNPFSRAQRQLPSKFYVTSTDKEIVFFNFLIKAVLSSSPLTKDVIAMGVYMNVCGMLAITRPGDKGWTAVAGYPNMYPIYFEDCVFYQGQFYAVSSRGKIVACDFGDGSKRPQLSLLMDCLVDNKMSPKRKHYLVEVSGELVMVVRFLDWVEVLVEDAMFIRYRDPSLCDLKLKQRTVQFKMYKLNLGAMKFEELKSLGDHSLFLGVNTSVSVLVPDYFGLGSVRRNCVYFADDLVCEDYTDQSRYKKFKTRNDIGVFDLEDSSITPHYRGTFTKPWNSIWIIPEQSK